MTSAHATPDLRERGGTTSRSDQRVIIGRRGQQLPEADRFRSGLLQEAFRLHRSQRRRGRSEDRGRVDGLGFGSTLPGDARIGATPSPAAASAPKRARAQRLSSETIGIGGPSPFSAAGQVRSRDTHPIIQRVSSFGGNGVRTSSQTGPPPVPAAVVGQTDSGKGCTSATWA
ncbi:MAG: hypothetical protein U0794_03580 [Isosphaeraceae bacterium]